jgi:hypothetical protein
MKKFLPESLDVWRTTGAEHCVQVTIVSQSEHTVDGDMPRRVVRIKRWVLSVLLRVISVSSSGDITLKLLSAPLYTLISTRVS